MRKECGNSLGADPLRSRWKVAQVASDLLLGQLRGKCRESVGGVGGIGQGRPRWLVHCRHRGTRSLYKGRGRWERDYRGRTSGSAG